jgi:Excalibur calcium-binding domain
VTHPAPDEPSEQRRAAVYGRANQASAHYRPLRKGRPVGEPVPHSPPTSRAAKAAIRRRFALFVLAVLVAIAAGAAIFGVVLANPASMAQAPDVPMGGAPEPRLQPPPPSGRGAPVGHAPAPPTGSAPAADESSPRNVTTRKPAAGSSAMSPTVYYQNCNKARRAGAAPLYTGDPGYSAGLDKDGNGIACDEKEKDKD